MKDKRFSKTFSTLLILVFICGYLPSRVNGKNLDEPFLKGWSEYENKNFNSALETWLPLAEKGNPDAQYFVGILYSNGLGVPVDFKEAGKWFHKSADQGDVGAQYYLGLFFETGKGFPQDFNQAGYWFKKAANQGYPDAQFHLGEWYSKENGAEQDFVLAYVWFALADGNGIQTAQTKMEEVQKYLTPKQLIKGRQLARQVWVRLERKRSK